MAKIKLIIGLGNPDPEYQETRHNIGFIALDYMAKKNEAEFEYNKNLNSFVAKSKIDKTSVVLAKPQTYVNKSGESAAKLLKFYKIKPKDIIVVHDDLDIDFGNFKLSLGKGSGGHKGVESIHKAIKTKDIYRLKIGISTKSLKTARKQSDKKRDEFVRNFVLSKFSKNEAETLKKLLKEAYERLVNIL